MGLKPYCNTNDIIKTLKEHSLSLFLLSLFITTSLISFSISESDTWLSDYIQNLSGDTFGGLLIVVATKYLIERGSAESK